MTEKVLSAQRIEITEHHVYKKLARIVRNQKDKETLHAIALQEEKHYAILRHITGKDVAPSYVQVYFYYYLSRIFGLHFGLRLMEKKEKGIGALFQALAEEHKEIFKIIQDEEAHEEALLHIVDDKKLEYTGSMVLGLNDALVELTGALAGLTLVLATTQLIAIVGLIQGCAASIAMAGSEYLSTKEEGSKNPLYAGTMTGIAYILTVFILISPYFFFMNPFVALICTLAFAFLIIIIFTFYSSVAKNLSFKDKFSKMAIISIGAAFINFGIGYLVKTYFGIE